MRQSIAILSLAATAMANTQVKFFWPGFDSDASGAQPDASIISANPSTTVMGFACPTNVDSTDCGWGSGEITYSIISTTIYAASMSAESLDLSFGCTAKDVMTCVVAMPADLGGEFSASGVVADGSMVTATTTLDSVQYQTATVTAGEEKLKATGGASASASAAASTGASAGSTLATAAASSSGASGANSTTSGAPAKSTTNAAGKFGVEGAAMLVLAGAAALNAL